MDWVESRVLALEVVAAGESATEAAGRVGVHPSTVTRWAKLAGMTLQLGKLGGVADVAERRRKPKPVRTSKPPAEPPEGPYTDHNGRLDFAGRVLIAFAQRAGWTQSRIAQELRVHPATVSNELKRGTINGRYDAKPAHKRCVAARARPKPHKLVAGSRLRAEVVTRLNDRYSPQQVAGRLRLEFGDDEQMTVSHETIYQALYVQGAGSLRHELSVEKALRRGGTRRKPRSELPPRPGRPWIGDATITKRPPEAADRAVPGHWEGDLVIGTDRISALITLNERRSRFVLISRITCHDTVTVTERLTQMITGLPEALFASLTWDQGVEMADHATFTIDTGCPVFFCDPHSPWQRPTNENSNGLIRDFFPKGTTFNHVTDEQVAEAERLLNKRPREILGFRTPAETLNELLTVAVTP